MLRAYCQVLCNDCKDEFDMLSGEKRCSNYVNDDMMVTANEEVHKIAAETQKRC